MRSYLIESTIEATRAKQILETGSKPSDGTRRQVDRDVGKLDIVLAWSRLE
jgi:hypothetical protein